MRLLNSICKVIASKFAGVPVHIEEVPQNFKRGCFYVTSPTGASNLINSCVYRDEPLYQIIYFGERNEANQVLAEDLYRVQETLKEIFLLKKCVPILPKEGAVVEKPRYAKITSYTSDLRIDEGALYVKMMIDFTEDVPTENPYEIIGEVELETKVITNG